MNEKENPYELLNLPMNADPKKIKERYYALSKVFHPDKQSSEMYDHTKQYFEKIEEAYKAIASPFNRFLFENLGYEGKFYWNFIFKIFSMIGIHMLEKAQNKFIDLEENYDLHYDSYQEALNNLKFYEPSGQLRERKEKLRKIQQVFV